MAVEIIRLGRAETEDKIKQLSDRLGQLKQQIAGLQAEYDNTRDELAALLGVPIKKKEPQRVAAKNP